jgi:hypothetical protein
VNSFKTAGERYNNIADGNKILEIADDKLAAVKLEDAAAIAQASSTTPLLKEIAEAAGGQKGPGNLMKICGNQSDRMRAATATFLGTKQDQEKDFAVLLSEWARALFVGRTISAFFEVAGSQR